MNLTAAMADADALEAQARGRGRDVIYAEADARLVAAKDAEINDVGSADITNLMIRMTREAGNDMSMMPVNLGKSFVRQLFENLKAKLCENGSELWKLAQKGIGWGAGAIVGIIASVLTLNPASMALMVLVAVEIALVGFDTYCEI